MSPYMHTYIYNRPSEHKIKSIHFSFKTFQCKTSSIARSQQKCNSQGWGVPSPDQTPTTSYFSSCTKTSMLK